MRSLLIRLAILAALLCPGLSAAISRVNITESGAFSATSRSPATPTSCATNDILVYFLVTNNDHTISDYATNGFTEREKSVLASTGFSVATRLHDGASSSYTFTFNGATEVGLDVLVCYTGSDTSTPFDLDGIESGATPHTTAAITPNNNDSMLVGAIFVDPTGTQNCTEVSGFPMFSEQHDGANASLCLAEKLQTTATSEGIQFTTDASTWGEYTMAIKPGAAAAAFPAGILNNPLTF